MILVKGNRVKFKTVEGKILSLPAHHGIVHDPDGQQLKKCDVYFTPYRKLSRKPKGTTRAAARYFGANYNVRYVVVNVPRSGWKPVADVVMIYYVRTGLPGSGGMRGYHHPFQSKPVRLMKSGRCYKLDLPNSCIVDDRGFVFP